jgi:hypothetical protein
MITAPHHPDHPREPAHAAPFLRRIIWLIAPTVGTVLATALMSPSVARAVPSFARQMDMQCIDCHTEFPILNQFGRQFKLSGYTTSSDPSTTSIPPLAVMLQPSFTNTQAGQAGGAAPGFGNNNNFAVTQLSVFYAGRLLGPYADQVFSKDLAAVLDKIGIFDQTTYDGVAKAWHWDNTELRFANTTTVRDQNVTYGVYANNNPTMQDPWNSTPAWGFPFSGSGLAPTPDAGTLIEGGLSQQVVGVGVYTMVADTFYIDVGAYHTPGAQLQNSLGIDPTGETQIGGLAPYWRLAVDRLVGEAHWEIGAFGLAADTYPGRVQSAGKDAITDFGLDSQYQVSKGPHDVTAMLSWIYERQNWDASYALGNSSNPTDDLVSYKATLDYLYDKTFGGAVQYFLIDGSSDAAIFSGSQTGSPTSDGVILQLNYLPFNKSGGPAFWPKSNVKFSLQYVLYNRFNGARANYDGNGSNAQDNDTLYAEVWIVF